MKWIFLSPHLDDAVLSCGGLIHSLTRKKHIVEIWTICAGNPPPGPLSPLAQELHKRWQTAENAPEIRRDEDATACAVIGSKPIHFDTPECIYRFRAGTQQSLIETNDELFQPLPEGERPLAAQITLTLIKRIDKASRLVSPLAIGGHIDHHLVRAAAEGLKRTLYYYADYPYTASTNQTTPHEIQTEWRIVNFQLHDEDLIAWQTAAAAYKTQISTFWSGFEEMKKALYNYRKNNGGSLLWLNQFTEK